MKIKKLPIYMLLPLLLSGCVQSAQPAAGTTAAESSATAAVTTTVTAATEAAPADSYRQISQETAKEMMQASDGHIILDVRRQDEFDSGHIEGAVCLPNESIGTVPPAELPDFGQVILVYCRSGRRSKEAAQKLFDMGYTNVYEFGGIIDWIYGTVTESGDDMEYWDMTPTAVLIVEVGDRAFSACIESNSSAEAFFEKVRSDPAEVVMHDYGGFEKVGDLPWELPTNDAEITAVPGDIILYQGNKICLYYGENTWSFTKLGSINAEPDELREALGDGDLTVKFWLEWTE